MGLTDMGAVLRRRWRVAVPIFAITLGLGAAASFIMPPSYRASTTVAIEMPSAVTGDQGGSTPQAWSPDATSPGVDTTAELASSAMVRKDALARLGPVIGARAAAAVLRSLHVEPVRNTNLLRISVVGRSPKIAGAAADAVTAALIEVDGASRARQAKETRQAIQRQLAMISPRLRASEDALAAFNSQHKDVVPADHTALIVNKLAQLEAQRVDLSLQLQEMSARMAAARDHLSGQARISPTEWIPSPLIASLQSQLATQEVELSGLRSQFTPRHPAVLDIEAKIAETKRRLDVELRRSLQADKYGVDPVYQRLVEQLRQDEVTSASLGARAGAVDVAIGEYEDRLQQLPVLELQQARLARDAKEADVITQMLSQRLQRAVIDEASAGSVIRVVDGTGNVAQAARSRWMGAVLGGVLGVMLGLGGALLKEQLDDPVKSGEDAGALLRLPVLGTIPEPARNTAAFKAQLSRPQFAEAFRYLRTNLLSLPKEPLHTLLVTSPGPDEGSDIVATNLSIALAQSGRRVWLVECDLRKPTLSRTWASRHMPGQQDIGLAEFLRGEKSVTLDACRTAIDNLWFLRAGGRPTDPAELLGNGKMGALLERSKDTVDVLVLLAPPLSAVADAAILASRVHGVLLVVQANTTPRDAAYWAREQLEGVGATVLGVIVTGAPRGSIGGYGGNGSSYYGAEHLRPWQVGPGSEAPARRSGVTALFRGNQRLS
jgi:capsular exopolysaccharide synthesis family protein